MTINFFAKPAFVNTSPGQPYTGAVVRHGHLQRVSSMIRADQIAERLGKAAALNPGVYRPDDVCIYVKPHVKSGERFIFDGRHPWLDIIDGWRLLPVLQAHPEVGVIACSETDGQTLRGLLPNRVVVIPQHHANFERVMRQRQGVTVAGVIGTEQSFDCLPPNLEMELAARGIRLWRHSRFFTRQDIIDFYMNIDVQIVWRPWRKRLANPLKIVNAAAFGVPTVALDEPYFREVAGYYLPVSDFNDLLLTIDSLRNFTWQQTETSCLAETYHIDRIAEEYRALEWQAVH